MRHITRHVLAGLMLALWGAVGSALAQSPAQSPAPPPAFWKNEWPKTDFAITSVAHWSEIRGGGPPRDGIPAISDPKMIAVAQENRLGDREPVIALELPGQTPRAYPVRYLMWHEIVNDVVGEVPVAVTFCPLCNSGIVFDRRLNGEVLSFGVSGKLRNSDMVMYDHETESWWQQAIGTGIVGAHTGDELDEVTSWMESWASFRARNPEGLVMDQPNWSRNYGTNPYANYDSSRRPFLFNGEMPPHGIPALARVVRVGNRAWPLERLRKEGEVNEAGVRIVWTAGQASALDSRKIADGRDVGAVRVYDAAGNSVLHDVMFAFAFNAFWPEPKGIWMLGR